MLAGQLKDAIDNKVLVTERPSTLLLVYAKVDADGNVHKRELDCGMRVSAC